MKVHGSVMAISTIVMVCAAQGIQAQARDSLVVQSPARPSKIYVDARPMRVGPGPGFRIIGSAQQLLLMTPPDTSGKLWSEHWLTDSSGLNPDHIDEVRVVKSANAIAKYGSAYANGVIEITLTQTGTEAWLAHAAARAAKPTSTH